MKWIWFIAVVVWTLIDCRPAAADPAKYPQYAQQELPKGVTPEFINLNSLVDEILQRKKVTIIDVRSLEEYRESHIKGSISVPVNEIAARAAEIPRDGLAVLY